jgi:hypothetical protein
LKMSKQGVSMIEYLFSKREGFFEDYRYHLRESVKQIKAIWIEMALS